MKGDFTRDTFDPTRHFSRVLMQQGRVQLDSDWNEQAAITLHYLRALAADLIGPHGGSGFMIRNSLGTAGEVIKFDFALSPGNYYVDGILCENANDFAYKLQSGYNSDPALPELKTGLMYLAYLDVWERHVTYHEEPAIRESALGGIDTATRTRVEWQVKLLDSGTKTGTTSTDDDVGNIYNKFIAFLNTKGIIQPGDGQLAARVPLNAQTTDACVVPSDNRYRGVENQLYRVEIHRPGTAWDGNNAAIPPSAATFKWSRENGSVVFAVVNDPPPSAGGATVVTLEEFGRDKKLDLSKDDWVELIEHDYIMRNDAKPLLRVTEIDRDEMTVTLEGTVAAGVGANQSTPLLLRRWDHRAGRPSKGADIVEGALVVKGDDAAGNEVWLELEDGIEIRFAPAGRYQTGDYWLIPARTATGDIEWPRDPKTASDGTTTFVPRPARAQGVKHSYAPLAMFSFTADGVIKPITPEGDIGPDADFRRELKPRWA